MRLVLGSPYSSVLRSTFVLLLQRSSRHHTAVLGAVVPARPATTAMVTARMRRSSSAMAVTPKTASTAVAQVRIPATQLPSPPLSAPSSSFQSFVRGAQSSCCLIPNAFGPHEIQAWKRDAVALKRMGFGSPAGVVGSSSDSKSIIRRGVHQIWLASPNTASVQTVLGDVLARNRLLYRAEEMRRQLMGTMMSDDNAVSTEETTAIPPLDPSLSELSYLLYGSSGAYYQRHVDRPSATSENSRNITSQRVVSFVLFLGSDDSDGDDADEARPWDVDRDGGALRIFGDAASRCNNTAGTMIVNGDDQYVDVIPTPGTLVIFDSATVPHEVRPTFRSRICAVGWFRCRTMDE